MLTSNSPLRANVEEGHRFEIDITDEDKKPISLPNDKAFQLFKSGRSLQQKGNYKAAIKKYQSALDLGLVLWQTYLNAGVCYSQTEDFRLAYDSLIEAHKRNPKNFLICKHLAFVCQKLGKKEEAKAWAQRFNSL